jgi:capsular exopolysaccharide synthesis family protein
MLGLGLALLQDWMDQRLRSVEEIASLMDVPVLGLVPSMPPRLTRSERGTSVQLQPRSSVAEAYRTLRTAIYFGGSSSRTRSVLITSPSPGDGKSTVVSNLAIAMAQAGERVLIIDADCRRPTQHQIFGVSNEAGLSTILLGETTPAQAIQSTSVTNLLILPCGPLPANPAEVINSMEFSDLLEALASQYDRVLLDAPPVIPVTDARILAASCDATIVVIRADKSNRKLSVHTVDSLRSVGAAVLGVVVNDVSNKRGRYGSYYYANYGGYHSHYGSDINAAAASSSSNGRHNKNGNGVAQLAAIGPDQNQVTTIAENGDTARS